MTEQLIIAGERRDAAEGATFSVTEPATGKPLADVAKASAVDVDLALTAATKAFNDGRGTWARTSGTERGRVLLKVSQLIAVGWMLYQPVFNILMGPLERLSGDPDVSDKLLVLDPLEGFMLRLKMSAYIGLAICMPYLLWQIWRFISPGLYQNERRYASAFVFSATFLFLFGAAVAYYTLEPALSFLQSVGGENLRYEYSPTKYLMLIVYMMLAFGFGFEFPIVLVALQLVGVLTPQKLRSFRRFGIVIIFVVAAVITPSADPISLFALAIPMIVFYEVSILIGLVVVRRRAANEVSSGA